MLIFEIDPRNHLSEQHIMEFGACFGVIWTLCVLSFQYSDALSIPTYASPITLYLLMALFLFNPTKTFRHEARFWTIRVLWRIFLAPFYYVSFADFFVADQLNSIVPAFLDLQFLICFYYKNPNWEIASPEGKAPPQTTHSPIQFENVHFLIKCSIFCSQKLNHA